MSTNPITDALDGLRAFLRQFPNQTAHVDTLREAIGCGDGALAEMAQRIDALTGRLRLADQQYAGVVIAMAEVARERDELRARLRRPGHQLYVTADADAPEFIKDRNGEVCLGQCRRCGLAEVELSRPCVPPVDEAAMRDAWWTFAKVGGMPTDMPAEPRAKAEHALREAVRAYAQHAGVTK